jgi:D-mannonate dehydratase
LEDDWKSLPSGEAGRVTQDEYWDRITYFLEKVIPVAKENGVFMACHPSDPPGLPATLLLARLCRFGSTRRQPFRSGKRTEKTLSF